MPEETAVAEAPPESPVAHADPGSVAEIAEEALAPSPEAPAEVAEAGEAQPPAPEETPEPAPQEREVDWKGMSAKSLDAIYEGMDEAERKNSSVLAEIERRAEQRVQTRLQEEQEARGATQTAHQELIQHGKQAEQWYDQVVRESQYDFRDLERATDPQNYDADRAVEALKALRQRLDPELLAGAKVAMKAAEAAEVGQRQAQENAEVVKAYADIIGTFTESEQGQLKEAAYKDRLGGSRAMKLIVGIIRDRAVEQGVTKGREAERKNREGNKEILDRINKGQEVRNGVAPDIKGQPPGDNSHNAIIARIAEGNFTPEDKAYWRQWEQSRRT
jgi:hypothetical protein